MKQDQVVALLSALGGKVTSKSPKRVMCKCVFAPFNHSGGVDNHPSSFMRVKNGFYSCYTCKEQGSAYIVYKKLKILYGGNPPPKVNFKAALEIIDGAEDYDEDDFPDYEEEINKAKQLIPFDESEWANYEPAIFHPYTLYRDIPEELARDIDIRLDPKRNRILFPIRDWEGVLMGIHGRTFLEDVEPRYYAYPGEDGHRNPSVWLGEHHTDLDEPVVLTEGQFDYAKVREHYDNVLASNGGLAEFKLKRIANASEIITAFDYGVGGDNARKEIDKYFDVPITHLLVPEKYGDLGNMPSEKVYELLCSIP